MTISQVLNNGPAWWQVDNHEKSSSSEPPQVEIITNRYSGIRRQDGRTYGEPVNHRVMASGMHLFVYKPEQHSQGKKPEDIFGGFSQWDNDNCVSVAAIKMAMMQFGEQPTDVFKEVREIAHGFQVTLRNNQTIYLTQDELEMAAFAAKFKGEDPRAITSANFIFAVMAEVERQKRPGVSYGEALTVMNRPDAIPLAFERLGLLDQIEMVAPEDLAGGRLGAFHGDNGKDGTHTSVSVGGKEERWGNRGGASPTGENIYAYAFKKT
ncbi:hypothetical protein LVW35_06720 [Pseudomonas sp. HN11]|uniref:hypothetical protein n=1 Tax=Pseudomonas sp. HN11 TaxID=1344094 RepID=UPI001F230BC6|nr:hypothetical protein [Pseudomonas sp. HN11]UII72867.1 hypothetical protein LVW35_06720 [Pseudomonas sp. HN11]